MHFLTLYKIAPAKFKKTNDDKNVVAYLANNALFHVDTARGNFAVIFHTYKVAIVQHERFVFVHMLHLVSYLLLCSTCNAVKKSSAFVSST